MLNKELFKEKIGMFNLVVNKQLDAVSQKLYFQKLEYLDNKIFSEAMDNLFENQETFWSVPSIHNILKEYTKIISKNNDIFTKIMIDTIKYEKQPKYVKSIKNSIENIGGWNFLKKIIKNNIQEEIELVKMKFYKELIKIDSNDLLIKHSYNIKLISN